MQKGTTIYTKKLQTQKEQKLHNPLNKDDSTLPSSAYITVDPRFLCLCIKRLSYASNFPRWRASFNNLRFQKGSHGKVRYAYIIDDAHIDDFSVRRPNVLCTVLCTSVYK
jgi:hypothetical protein